MHSKCQQFVATLLLFSILLQSCGNPNCQMAEPVHPSARGKISNPRSRVSLAPVNQQEDDSEIAPVKGTSTIDRHSEALVEVASEASCAHANVFSGQTHGDGLSSTSFSTTARSSVASIRQFTQAARLSSGSKGPLKHVARKPQHGVSNKAPISQKDLQKTEQAQATPRPSHALRAGAQHTNAAHLSQTEVKLSTENTVHQTPSCATLPSAATQPYPSAQGHQVRFQKVEGIWQATVQDVWKCVQVLPVLCAWDQTLEQAIQQLASKVLGQHKYWVHILETDQPPWAPRVVYVGVLGLLGGGNSSSSDGSRGGNSRSDGAFRSHIEGTAAMREIDRRSSAESRSRRRNTDFTMATNHPDPVERMCASTRLFSGHRAEANSISSSARNDFNRTLTEQNNSSEAHRRSRDATYHEEERKKKAQQREKARKRQEEFEHRRKEEARQQEAYRREKEARSRELQEQIAEARRRVEEFEVGSARRTEEENRKQQESQYERQEARRSPEEDRKMPATPAATTVPSTKKKVGGAVVSSGFVLDSKGRLRPHEVRIPSVPPARYHEARHVVTPAIQDVCTTDISKQGVRQSLYQSIEEYKKACDADETFRRQHIGLTTLTEQLKHDATNAVLLVQLQEQEASFQQHPLYHQGSKLAQDSQKLRDDELAKATHIMLSKSEMQLGMGSEKLKQRKLHRQEAADIREAFLQPVRARLNRTSTPPRVQRTGEFVLGVGESATDTAKFAVDLLGLAGKLLGGAAHSIVTWEDKLGIGEKITDASALIDTLCKQTKYEWENLAEYQERRKATQSYHKELECIEKALNAEAYHNRRNRNLGYWSGEALQTVFGAEIIKGAGQVVKGTVQVGKVAGKAAKATGSIKQVAKPAKAAGSVMEKVTVEGVARISKVEGNVAKVAERVGEIAKVKKVAGASEAIKAAKSAEEVSKKVKRAAHKVVQASKKEGGVGVAAQGVKASEKMAQAAENTKLSAAAGKVEESVKKARKGATVIQSGGHVLTSRTRKALGLNKEQGKFAIETMKKAENIPNNFHGQIMKNGDYVDPHTKEVLGNLFEYQGASSLAKLDALCTSLQGEVEALTSSLRILQPMLSQLEDIDSSPTGPCGVLHGALQRGAYDATSMAPHLASPLLGVISQKAVQSNVALSKPLLDKGTAVKARDRERKPPLQYIQPEIVNDPRVNREKQTEIATLLGRLTALRTQYQDHLQEFSGDSAAPEQAQANGALPVFSERQDALDHTIASLKSAQVQLQQQCTTAHEALFKTLKNSDQEAIEMLLDDPKLDVKAKDEDLTPLLCLAAEQGNIEAMRKLIDNGADVNERGSKEGLTPLQAAINNGGISGVRLLLEHPSIDLQKYGKFVEDWQNMDYAYPPFFLACSELLDDSKDFEQGIAIVKALLASGIDPSMTFKVYISIHDVLRRSSINDINELRKFEAEALMETEDGEYIEEVLDFCDLEIMNDLECVDRGMEKQALLGALLDKYWPN